MGTHDGTAESSRGMIWAGRIISALPVLMLLFSGVMKLAKPAAVVSGFHDFGYPEQLIIPIGILELACTIAYLVPRTSVVGAILLTGYLGGATATNVRVENWAFIAPVLCGVFVWLGLFFRNQRLQELLLGPRPALSIQQREEALV